jgi:hypothetical protein
MEEPIALKQKNRQWLQGLWRFFHVFKPVTGFEPATY